MDYKNETKDTFVAKLTFCLHKISAPSKLFLKEIFPRWPTLNISKINFVNFREYKNGDGFAYVCEPFATMAKGSHMHAICLPIYKKTKCCLAKGSQMPAKCLPSGGKAFANTFLAGIYSAKDSQTLFLVGTGCLFFAHFSFE